MTHQLWRSFANLFVFQMVRILGCCNLYPQLNQFWKRSAKERVIKMLSVHASSVFSIRVWVKKDLTSKLTPSTSNDIVLAVSFSFPLRKSKIGHRWIVPLPHLPCRVPRTFGSDTSLGFSGKHKTLQFLGTFGWRCEWMSGFLCWTFQV